MVVFRSRLLRVAASGVLSLVLAAHASAATIYVETLGDAIESGDGCSLREAVINANTDSTNGSYECEKGVGADRIVLPPKAMRVAAPGTQDDNYDASISDLDVIGTLTIVGGGEQLTKLNAAGIHRLFDLKPGSSLTLRHLTLLNGFAADVGGAIRVGDHANLLLQGVVIQSSRAGATGGRGGALHLGAFSTTRIVRSFLASNQASGLGGRGAAIYCDGCTVDVHASTMAGNVAALEGGALWLSGEGRANFSFVTLFQNRAATGAGIQSYGDLVIKAGLITDNGIGAAGDDLTCASGSFAATYTFAEFPSLECRRLVPNVPEGMQTRADLAGTAVSFPTLLKSDWRDYEASDTYVWLSSLAQSSQVVPAVSCVEGAGGSGRLQDQLGRRIPEGSACDIGAAQYPAVFGVSSPVSFAQSGGDDVPVSVWASTNAIPVGNVDRDTTVVLRSVPVGDGAGGTDGAAEDCGFPETRLVIAAGNQRAVFLVDPDRLFGGVPMLNRPDRVCELVAEVESGDPQVKGATTSPIRIALNDPRSSQDIAVPGNNEVLDFGFVAIGSGGIANIIFRAQGAGWTMTVPADAISDDATGRFSVVPGVQAVGTGGTALPVTCGAGGAPGLYTGSLSVRVSDGSSVWTYSFGLSCRVGHALSISAEPRPIGEGQSSQLVLQLDSASVLDEFQVELVRLAGTAGAEDVVFSPGGGVVTFRRGEREQVVEVQAVDDTLIEGVESLLVGFAVVNGASLPVYPVGATSVELDIVSDDVVFRALQLSDIQGFPDPARMPAGTHLEKVRAILTNISHPEAPEMTSVAFALSVDRPAWVRSFVARQCGPMPAVVDESTPECPPPVVLGECRLESSNRAAHCRFPDPLTVGETVEVLATLDMAEIRDAPTLEVSGTLSITATALSGGVPVTAVSEKPYLITGVGSAGAGGSLSLPALMVAMLLALRGLRRRSVGWKVRQYE